MPAVRITLMLCCVTALHRLVDATSRGGALLASCCCCCVVVVLLLFMFLFFIILGSSDCAYVDIKNMRLLLVLHTVYTGCDAWTNIGCHDDKWTSGNRLKCYDEKKVPCGVLSWCDVALSLT